MPPLKQYSAAQLHSLECRSQLIAEASRIASASIVLVGARWILGDWLAKAEALQYESVSGCAYQPFEQDWEENFGAVREPALSARENLPSWYALMPPQGRSLASLPLNVRHWGRENITRSDDF